MIESLFLNNENIPTATTMLSRPVAVYEKYIKENTPTVSERLSSTSDIGYLPTSDSLEADSLQRHIKSYDTLERSLYGFLSLSDGWDGYDGIVPSLGVIITSSMMLDKIRELYIEAPKPMLASSGEVGLYWKNKQHYLEICFDTKDSFSYMYDGVEGTFAEADIELENLLPSLLISKLALFGTIA